MRWVLALALLAGCGAESPPSVAERAWAAAELFSRGDAPPAVEWVTEYGCIISHGRFGFWLDGKCYDGATLDAWHVMVARRPWHTPADTPLPHELIHAWLRRQGLDSDPTHLERPELWYRPGTMEDRVRAWIRENQLPSD